jgi:hypothetical protein
VGQWIFDVDTRSGQEAAMFSAQGNPIYILFNPWCPSKSLRIIYVLHTLNQCIYRMTNLWFASHMWLLSLSDADCDLVIK